MNNAEILKKYQFQLGHSETIEVKKKRIAAFMSSWKNRDNYIGDIKHPYIYNVWRSFKFTIKGKKIGWSDEWNNYRTFYNDVISTYIDGYKFQRIDKKIPFCKDNFMWVDPKSMSLLKDNSILLTYNNETLTIKEWANKLNLSVNGIKLRYYRNKNYSIEEILLGKKRLPSRSKINSSEITYKELREKASKMCSSYRIRDRKKRYNFDLTIDWLIENILLKACVYCGTSDFIGCDRLNNKEGHTKDNVVPCCQTCNMVRGDNFTVDEMKMIGKCISEIRNTKIKMKT